MSKNRDMERLLTTYLEHLSVPCAGHADAKVLPAALAAMHEAKSPAAQPCLMTWRTIMTCKASKLTAAALIVGVTVFALFDRFTQPAWALDDAIKALKDFRAIYMVGAFPGGTAEIWVRANASRTHSADMVVRGSTGTVTWVQDGSTYHYEPSQNTVYFEQALTLGMSQWLGPELLEMFRTAETAQMVRGKDPATGRDRVLLLCSLIDVHGAQSWSIEFDAASNLPVAIKQWPNLDRSGPASFESTRIVYYEDLPDSLFDVPLPAGVLRVEKPLEIAAQTVGALSNPQDGISADGLTQQEAAEKAVRILYQATIDQDLDQLKSICPLCRNWGDEFLRKIVFKPDKDDRIVEVLEIGPISKTGRSALGTIAAIPTIVKLHNGKKARLKMIVQFRNLAGQSSCVVHGPYGLPREIE
ncbi:MAG: hypothetical protein MUC88_08080 [Planctomycetes bacterium]|nr:hypothetical protein [Planctomycetota bacterium]